MDEFVQGYTGIDYSKDKLLVREDLFTFFGTRRPRTNRKLKRERCKARRRVRLNVLDTPERSRKKVVAFMRKRRLSPKHGDMVDAFNVMMQSKSAVEMQNDPYPHKYGTLPNAWKRREQS